jgi:hypothetical protein
MHASNTIVFSRLETEEDAVLYGLLTLTFFPIANSGEKSLLLLSIFPFYEDL